MKARGHKSKKKTTVQRRKIDRKKREHKRDLRKAAKTLKEVGAGGQVRNKRTRELAKLALKISNAHPDKEQIISHVLQQREAARVTRADKRLQRKEMALRAAEGGEEADLAAAKQQARAAARSNARSLLFIPTKDSNNFALQFNKALNNVVFPIPTGGVDAAAETINAILPSVSYLVTLDARFAVASVPWTLLDAIVSRGEEYAAAQKTSAAPVAASARKKRERQDEGEVAETPAAVNRKVLILFAMTKVDLVSAQTIVTQVSLVADAVHRRYFAEQQSAKKASTVFDSVLPGGIQFAMCPFSTQFEKTGRNLLRMLRQFNESQHSKGVAKSGAPRHHNMYAKQCCFVIGLPNTGRRTLIRTLSVLGTESNVATVPFRAAQVQIIKGQADGEVQPRFVFPNAKQLTLVQFAEDVRLRKESMDQVAGGDVVFQSFSFIERLLEPEAIAIMIVNSCADKTDLAQAFCQPFFSNPTEAQGEDSLTQGPARFLKGIGATVRREKGFHVSPLFVSSTGTAGQLSANSLTASSSFTSRQQSSRLTMLDATYSNASPMKLVRVADMVTASRGKGKRNLTVKRVDAHNALRLGARTFVREFCQSRNVPWAILRAPEALTMSGVANAMRIFDFNLLVGQRAPTDAQTAYEGFIGYCSSMLKEALVLLPNNVVEFQPNCIVPALHNLDEEPDNEESDDDEDDPSEPSEGSDEEGSERESEE